MSSLIRVAECFGPVLQGEGALAGTPTVFVRLGSCDYRCSWCDSLHAVLPEHKEDWEPMTSHQIMDRVADLSGDRPLMVTLSGGNPALWPLRDLLDLGHKYGYTFAMETQGSVAPSYLKELDHLVVSPKPPSSKMATNFKRLDLVMASAPQSASLKVVVFDPIDYEYAREVWLRYRLRRLPFYLQVGNVNPPSDESATERFGPRDHDFDIKQVLDGYAWLEHKVIEDKWYEVRVGMQLHTLIHGNRRGT